MQVNKIVDYIIDMLNNNKNYGIGEHFLDFYNEEDTEIQKADYKYFKRIAPFVDSLTNELYKISEENN